MQNQQYQQPPQLPKKGISTPIIILIVVLSMCGLCGILGTIAPIFQKDKPAKPASESSKSSSSVTLDNFNKIKTGMTYQQVVEILGRGQVISENEIGGYITTTYQWKGEGFGNISIIFQNGKLISKSQFGL